MRPIRSVIALAVMGAALMACTARQGQEFDVAAISSLRPGATTYTETVAMMGAPMQTAYAEDGSFRARWYYAKGHAVARGLASGQGEAVVIGFRSDGVMQRIISRSSARSGIGPLGS